MKNTLFFMMLFCLVGCGGYELDKLETSEHNNKLLTPPCLEK